MAFYGLGPFSASAAAAYFLRKGDSSMATSATKIATVITVDRDRYMLRWSDGSHIPAQLAGHFRHAAIDATEFPCVGDRVGVEMSASTGVIHSVLPRETVLQRKRPGKGVEFQLIAANIDVAFIVQGCHFDFNVRRLDRYLVVCRDGGIRPVIVLTKTDLVSQAELDNIVRTVRDAGIDADMLRISNVTGLGLDELTGMLKSGLTYCLLGSSGVGKTTLINRLLGTDYATQPVSATGEGIHTTTRRQIVETGDGAYFVDTPGMRELGIVDAGDGISDSFRDIAEMAEACRFANCTHAHEPGCAVRDVVDDGELASYHKLTRESERNAQAIHERRQSDRDFKKKCKAILKNHRRHDGC
jgi:ribosome biogenesis GTPase / thiamine phosphate phosphatase